MTENKIHQICKRYNVTNYTINSDMSIDVEGDVDLHRRGLTELPLTFNIIHGGFYCGDNSLISLKGSPIEIHGNFNCIRNKLKSLKYSPEVIKGNAEFPYNKIKDLKHVPKCHGIDLFNNDIRDFKYLENIKILDVSGINPVYEIVLLFSGRYGRPSIEQIKYFNELDIIRDNGYTVILDRLNYFLQDMGKDEIQKNDIVNYIVK